MRLIRSRVVGIIKIVSGLNRRAPSSGERPLGYGVWEKLTERPRIENSDSTIPSSRASAVFIDRLHRQVQEPVIVVHANLTRIEQELSAELRHLREGNRAQMKNDLCK